MKWPPAHEDARKEFKEAVAYLREKVSKHLARRFTLSAMDTVRRARRFPESGSPIGRHSRRMQIGRFSRSGLSARGRRHLHRGRKHTTGGDRGIGGGGCSRRLKVLVRAASQSTFSGAISPLRRGPCPRDSHPPAPAEESTLARGRSSGIPVSETRRSIGGYRSRPSTTSDATRAVRIRGPSRGAPDLRPLGHRRPVNAPPGIAVRSARPVSP